MFWSKKKEPAPIPKLKTYGVIDARGISVEVQARYMRSGSNSNGTPWVSFRLEENELPVAAFENYISFIEKKSGPEVS